MRFTVIMRTGTLLLSALLTGCGGGGGGGADLSYTGATSAAVISTGNAEPLALESFTSGMTAGSAQDAQSAVVAVGDKTSRLPGTGLIVSRLVQSAQVAAQGLVTTAAGGSARSLVSIQQTKSVSGGCGGSASGTVTIDDVTSDIYASMSFDHYCEAGVTLSGSMNFSLILDSTSADYGLMLMNFNNVRATDAIESVALSGSMRFDSFALNPAMTINMLLQDPSGKVYRLKNFVMTLVAGTDGGGDFVDVSMTGRLYDPDYGYVELTTTAPMRVYASDNWPSTGIYVLTGAGNATVTLTASPTGYQLDLDLNGDGIDDGTPITGSWATV